MYRKLFQNLLVVEKSKSGKIIITFNNQENSRIAKCDFVHMVLYFYPTNTKYDADSFKFLPYEEYVNDVSRGKRSSYGLIDDFSDEFFGLILGIIIALIFLFIDPVQLVSIQSVAAIIGAYLVGKEFWNDLNGILVDMTRKWRVKITGQPFYYKREDFGTIQKFWDLARKERDSQSTVLADEIDFITHSNSKTLELFFTKDNLSRITKNSNIILKIESGQGKDLFEKNYFLGGKLILGKNFLGIKVNHEMFESIKDGKLGSISRKNNWTTKETLVKKTIKIGRAIFYVNQKYEPLD